jgi:Holliday junction resolvasome RuvABC endonuclease subunit
MKIIGVDPGTKSSGLCVLDIEEARPTELLDADNNMILSRVIRACRWQDTVVAYEWVQNYGRVVGEEVLRTAHMCGRIYAEAWESKTIHEPTRPMIVRHFTGQQNAPKPHVRQAILDRFGGKEAKKKGNKLYGVSNHKWDALAVCIYIAETIYDIEENYWQTEGSPRW